ncbi:hypothetical protein DIPPA_02022, partial [Diplonema papillatum]
MAAALEASSQAKAYQYAAGLTHFASLQVVPVGFKLAAYPMERLRLLMQTQHTNKTYTGSSFSSIARTVSHIKTEGMISAWRGASPTIIRWLPSQYIVLFLKEYLSAALP